MTLWNEGGHFRREAEPRRGAEPHHERTRVAVDLASRLVYLPLDHFLPRRRIRLPYKSRTSTLGVQISLTSLFECSSKTLAIMSILILTALRFLFSCVTSTGFLPALCTLLTVYLAGFLARVCRLWRSLPPGPRGAPILGYLPFIRRDFHLELTQLSKEYGPILSLRLGSQLVVVLSDHRLIREAFSRPEFDARPDNRFMQLLEGFGIVNAQGTLWKEQRRFVHKRLRQLGVRQAGDGRDLMETRIMTEVDDLLRNVSDRKGEPFELRPYLASSASNVVCSLLMSRRFGHDDPAFLRYMSLFDEGFRLFTVAALAEFVPVFKFLPSFGQAYGKIRQNLQEMRLFYRSVVDEHKDELEEEAPAKDLVDAYLKEPANSPLYAGRDPDRQIHQVVGDLFSAGSETIQTTLRWAIMFALREPEATGRVQEELDRVVGRARLPSLKDLPHLPQTEAFLMEVMRRATAVPLGTPHSVSRTTTLGGFTIPKGAHVISLLHAVHMDEENWKDPERFDPSRFLNAEGTKVVKPEAFIPFGVGHRMCLGFVLGKAELFLFTSCLLHSFHFRLPDGVSHPPALEDAIAGATVSPQLFQVCAVPRALDSGEDPSWNLSRTV